MCRCLFHRHCLNRTCFSLHCCQQQELLTRWKSFLWIRQALLVAWIWKQSASRWILKIPKHLQQSYLLGKRHLVADFVSCYVFCCDVSLALEIEICKSHQRHFVSLIDFSFQYCYQHLLDFGMDFFFICFHKHLLSKCNSLLLLSQIVEQTFYSRITDYQAVVFLIASSRCSFNFINQMFFSPPFLPNGKIGTSSSSIAA